MRLFLGNLHMARRNRLCSGAHLIYSTTAEARTFRVLALAPGVADISALFRAGRSAYYEPLGLLEPAHPQQIRGLYLLTTKVAEDIQASQTR
jgi:hypothetical protein